MHELRRRVTNGTLIRYVGYPMRRYNKYATCEGELKRGGKGKKNERNLVWAVTDLCGDVRKNVRYRPTKKAVKVACKQKRDGGRKVRRGSGIVLCPMAK